MFKSILLTLYLTSVVFYLLGQIHVQIESSKTLKKIGYKRNDKYKFGILNIIIGYTIIFIVSLIPLYNFIGALFLHFDKDIKLEVVMLKIDTGQYIKKT